MKNLNNYILTLLVLVLSLNSCKGQGTPKLNPPITDSDIRYGKLENGLTYYIKPIEGSETDIFLNLYVKAGNRHEGKDQASMAHYLEHMAFKASKNFPEGIHYDPKVLGDSGKSLIAINGHSGSNITEYNVKASSKNLNSVDVGLLWFKDIANRGLKLTEEDIDKERGIFKQEHIIRGGDNFQDFFQNQHLTYLLFPGSLDVRNFFDHLSSFKPEVLKNYYNDWYRPSSIGVSIVGNIYNADSLEIALKKQFSKIPVQENTRKIVDHDSIFYDQDPQFAIVKSDSDSSISSKQELEFHLYFRDKETHSKLSDMEGQYRLIKWRLLLDILNSRFKEKSNVYNSFFDLHGEYTHAQKVLPPSLKILVKSRGYKNLKALEEAIKILKQIHKYGVHDLEFTKSVQAQLKNLDYENIGNANYWVDEIQSHFSHAEPFPRNKQELIIKYLSNFSRNDFNEFFTTLNLEMPDDIGIIVSSGKMDSNISENVIRSKIKDTYGKTPEPYNPPKIPNQLLSKDEKGELKISDNVKSGYGESGAKEYLLNNGVRIVLKPFKPVGINKDKIFLHGFSPTGALDFPERDYFSAVNAPGFVKNSGVGKLDKFELQRFLSTKSIPWFMTDLYINNLESGIKMHSSPEDFETLLELVYLYFTDAIVTKVSFDDWRRNQEELYKDPPGDIKSTDLQTIVKEKTGDNSGVLLGTARFQGLDKTNMERGFEIYNHIFKNFQNFTFIISGDFSIDSITPLLKKYFGNLPAIGPNRKINKVKNQKVALTAGPFYKEFFFPGNYTKSNILYKPFFIKESEGYDWEEKIKMEALAAVTNLKVWELRFKKGYSLYNTGFGGNYNEGENLYLLSGNFNTDPKELPMIRKEFKIIYKRLRSELISQDLLNQSLMRNLMLSDSKGRGNSQRTMLEKLYSHYRYNLPWIDTAEIHEYIKTLTPEDILESAQKYFKDEYLFEFVLKQDQE